MKKFIEKRKLFIPVFMLDEFINDISNLALNEARVVQWVEELVKKRDDHVNRDHPYLWYNIEEIIEDLKQLEAKPAEEYIKYDKYGDIIWLKEARPAEVEISKKELKAHCIWDEH